MGQAICNEEIPNPTSFLYIRTMRVAGGRRTGVVVASVVIAVSQQSHYIWLRWGDMGNGGPQVNKHGMSLKRICVYLDRKRKSELPIQWVI